MRAITFTLTIGGRPVDIEAMPEDPPDASVGIRNWTFSITATRDGAPFELTRWHEDQACYEAEKIMRRGWEE